MMGSGQERRLAVCTVCRRAGYLGQGPGRRPNARCVRCGSLERHRALVGLVPALSGFGATGVVLDIAPTRRTSAVFRDLAVAVQVPYVGMDFDPAADNRAVDVQASLTEVPLRDASVGLLICYHVLEHVPDDAAAMAEIARVLAPGGVAVIQVPHRTGVATDEDPSAGVEERVARFGQADHVRYYGDDFESRLATAGLDVRRLQTADLYSPLEADLLGLREEPVWLATVGTEVDLDALRTTCAASAREAVAEALARLADERDRAVRDNRKRGERITRLRHRLARVEGARDRAQEQERRIRGRFEVRAAEAVRRALRRR